MKKIITVAVIVIMTICFTGCSEPEDIPTVETASANTTKTVTKEKKEQSVPATPITTAVMSKPTVSSKDNGQDENCYFCLECGQEVSKPNTLCEVCREPYYRLYGYGWVRCHVYGPGEIEWYTDNNLPCTCLPDEVCDSCRDKLNHGWKTSGEEQYYEYSDFLKEKGLTLVEASHPEQDTKSKKQEKKKQKKTSVKSEEPEIIEEPKQEIEPIEDIPEETKEEEVPCEEDTTTSNSVM